LIDDKTDEFKQIHELRRTTSLPSAAEEQGERGGRLMATFGMPQEKSATQPKKEGFNDWKQRIYGELPPESAAPPTPAVSSGELTIREKATARLAKEKARIKQENGVPEGSALNIAPLPKARTTLPPPQEPESRMLSSSGAEADAANIVNKLNARLLEKQLEMAKTSTPGVRARLIGEVQELDQLIQSRSNSNQTTRGESQSRPLRGDDARGESKTDELPGQARELRHHATVAETLGAEARKDFTERESLAVEAFMTGTGLQEATRNHLLPYMDGIPKIEHSGLQEATRRDENHQLQHERIIEPPPTTVVLEEPSEERVPWELAVQEVLTDDTTGEEEWKFNVGSHFGSMIAAVHTLEEKLRGKQLELDRQTAINEAERRCTQLWRGQHDGLINRLKVQAVMRVGHAFQRIQRRRLGALLWRWLRGMHETKRKMSAAVRKLMRMSSGAAVLVVATQVTKALQLVVLF